MFRALKFRPLSRTFTSRAVDGFTGAVGNTPLVSTLRFLFDTNITVAESWTEILPRSA